MNGKTDDGFEEFDGRFNEHFGNVYDESAGGYGRYLGAYRYGYDMAQDERYVEQGWVEAEESLEDSWNARGSLNDGLSWSDVVAAVRYAWVEVRDSVMSKEFQTRYDQTEAFNDHYESHFSSSGRPFDYYRPAYRYGYGYGLGLGQLALDDWSVVSTNARQKWEEDYEGDVSDWDGFEEAIRFGWERSKAMINGDIDMDGQFNRHYLDHYTAGTGPAEVFMPAYRYGAALALDDRYTNNGWDRVEAEARREWEQTVLEGKWEDIRGAVRFGWDYLRTTV